MIVDSRKFFWILDSPVTRASVSQPYVIFRHAHISIISCCNLVAYCNFVICLKWNYLKLSTPDCDIKQWKISQKSVSYLSLYQQLRWKHFIVETIFTKGFIIYVWQSPKWTSRSH